MNDGQVYDNDYDDDSNDDNDDDSKDDNDDDSNDDNDDQHIYVDAGARVTESAVLSGEFTGTATARSFTCHMSSFCQ